MTARLLATWYPGRDFRKRGIDVRLLGYNTDRKVHVRRLDTSRDFFVMAYELGGVTGGMAALNDLLSRLPYIPRKGGEDPGPPQIGDAPVAPAPKPAPRSGGAFLDLEDDMLVDGGLR